MKSLLFVHSTVGNAIGEWLINNHPEDIAAIIMIEELPVLAMAKKNDVPVIFYISEQELVETLSELDEFDLGILAWWPNIISPRLLALPKFGFVNTHPSYLPHNRGKNPNFWSIVEERPFGVSLHFVEQAVDAGRILAQRQIDYGWEDTGETLYKKGQSEMVDLFCSWYEDLDPTKMASTIQNPKEGSFHLSKEINKICKLNLDQDYNLQSLLNLLRGRTFSGHPACSFEDNGKEYEVRVEIKRKLQ